VIEADLAAARDALEHGSSKRALRHAWSAAISSVTSNDPVSLNDAIQIAEAIRDRSIGRAREQAAELAVYAAYARDHPQPLQVFGVTRRPT
jgi:hypothetical protein